MTCAQTFFTEGGHFGLQESGLDILHNDLSEISSNVVVFTWINGTVNLSNESGSQFIHSHPLRHPNTINQSITFLFRRAS